MRFANVDITDATIMATRKWFADNQTACMNEVVSGQVKVNNIKSYFEYCRQSAQDALDGKWDHTFAFMQRAHTIQTGECIPFLP